MTSLAELTWRSTEARLTPQTTLAVPLGATEQHGPHLPLTTDTDIAVALVDSLARQRPRVVRAPALPYGSSGEHAGFPGTMSIGQEALYQLVLELCRSASETFPRIVLVCAHGGNAEPLARAVSALRAECRAVMSWHPSWSGDAHAGHVETSIMLALAPDRVDLALAAPGALEPIQRLLPALRHNGVRAVSPNGVLGDPVRACPADGAELLGTAAADLIATLDDWQP